MKGIRI